MSNVMQDLPAGAAWGAYCSCGCGTLVSTDAGNVLPVADIVDHFVSDFDGDLDYIELFVRAHVIGRAFRDSHGKLFTARVEGDVPTLIAGDYSPLPTPNGAR
jgi:hypothetical protein